LAQERTGEDPSTGQERKGKERILLGKKRKDPTRKRSNWERKEKERIVLLKERKGKDPTGKGKKR
jgi:hypothetical protein